MLDSVLHLKDAAELGNSNSSVGVGIISRSLIC